MRQLPSDKYNVAWFKLAEFVSRGEKERALGLYRLLMHSFDDQALALQLEGDILLSFSDVAATERYEKAAFLYAQQGRFVEAMTILEHIIFLKPDALIALKKLLDLLDVQKDYIRVVELLERIAIIFCKQQMLQGVEEWLEFYQPFLKVHDKAELYKKIVVELCKHSSYGFEIRKLWLKKALDYSLESADAGIQKFLETLCVLDEDLYLFACDYIQK
ncbi:MAG: hypothetical protein AB7R69_01525 [Candidatus Babeliales bacterium]